MERLLNGVEGGNPAAGRYAAVEGYALSWNICHAVDGYALWLRRMPFRSSCLQDRYMQVEGIAAYDSLVV